MTISLALQECTLAQCFPGTASQSSASQCRASNFKVSRGLYLSPSFPSQHRSVPEMQFPPLLSFTFHQPCDADHAQCLLPSLTRGVFGYLFSTSSLNTSRDGPRHTKACVCTVHDAAWTLVSLSPEFLLRETGLCLH